MIYSVGISISLFLSVVQFTKRGRSAADAVLGVWLMLLGVHLFLYNAIWGASPMRYPALLGLEIPLPILQSVMLYLYVGVLTGQVTLSKLRWLGHLLPTAFVYAWLLPFVGLPPSEKLYVYTHQGVGYEVFLTVVKWLYSTFGVYYVIRAGGFWWHHRRAKRVGDASEYATPNLNWIRGLVVGMGLIWLVVHVSPTDQHVYGAVVLFVLWLGYAGIRQGDIFARTPGLAFTGATVSLLRDPEPESDVVDRPKYASSGLTDETAMHLYDRLTELMQRDALYKESNLTLAELAQRLDVPANYLSQVINEREGMGFPDYLGSLRIAAFKQLAADPKNSHLTLLGLAYECGFNSKSTFNRQFKKQTGQLPSAYWQQISPIG